MVKYGKVWWNWDIFFVILKILSGMCIKDKKNGWDVTRCYKFFEFCRLELEDLSGI
jgi:hypothetical protein